MDDPAAFDIWASPLLEGATVVIAVVFVAEEVATTDVEEHGVAVTVGEDVVMVEDVEVMEGFLSSCCNTGPESLGSVNCVVRL